MSKDYVVDFNEEESLKQLQSFQITEDATQVCLLLYIIIIVSSSKESIKRYVRIRSSSSIKIFK